MKCEFLSVCDKRKYDTENKLNRQLKNKRQNLLSLVIMPYFTSVFCASACYTGYHPNPATPKLPTHIETRTHDQCGDTIEKSQASDDGCINVRNMLSIEEMK